MKADHSFWVEDPTVLSVLRKMEQRSTEGMVTYGKSIRDNRKSKTEWLKDLQEELMDAAIYIEKLIEELDNE